MDLKISVIIPVYNRLEFIRQAVESVLSQTYKDIEAVVVDDGSTQNITSALSGISDSRLITVRQPNNKGVSAARNYGVSLSKYDWIAFLDSDDVWLPDKLEKQARLISQHPDIKIVYTGENWIRDGKPFNHNKSQSKFYGYIFNECLLDCFIGCSTVVMSKQLFRELGGFDESLPVCEDYDLWLKVSSKHHVYLIKEALINKNGGHHDQLSKKYWGNDRFRVQSIINIINSGKLDSIQVAYAKSVLLKKCAIIAKGSLKHKNYTDFNKYLCLMVNNKHILEYKNSD